MKGIITSILILLIVFQTSAQVESKRKYEVYGQSFNFTVGIPNNIFTLADSTNLIEIIDSSQFDKELNEIIKYLKSKKAKKRKRVIGPRVMVVFKYPDGSDGYIAGNKFTYFQHDNKIYRDRCYKLYELLERYTDIYDLEEFLESKKKRKKCR